MRTDSGFSLIEILIVLVIISISFGFALLAFGDFGKRREIIASAEQFVNYLTLVEQQAVLETSLFRIQFLQNNYQLSRYTSTRWVNMPEKSIFHTRHFSDAAIIRLEQSPAVPKQKGIIIYTTGQLTPFKLHLSSGQEEIATVIGESNGRLMLQVKKP